MTYRREIPKLNSENFKAWQGLKKLHLMSLSNLGCHYLENDYTPPIGTMTVEEFLEHKFHNIIMVDIASSLSYAKFDEVKDCKTAHEMWEKIEITFRGDENVKRAKAESLRGQFDQMKVREDENISQYANRIKASISAIWASGGKIEDATIVSKVLRTLLPIYDI